MSRVLSVTNKLLSLRGGINITDGRGELAYYAKGSFSLLSPTWRIYRGEQLVGSIRKRIFALRSTWDVQGELGVFKIKRTFFSFRRRYYAVGGALDGAIVTGNLFDLQFNVSRGGDTLAKAQGHLLTIRDRHEVEILAEPELFVVFVMIVLQLDRRDANRRAEEEGE